MDRVFEKGDTVTIIHGPNTGKSFTIQCEITGTTVGGYFCGKPISAVVTDLCYSTERHKYLVRKNEHLS